MSLQRVYLPVGINVKTYPISKFKAVIPLLGGCSGWIGKPVSITWDPTKTTVSSSRLVVKATPNADPVALDVRFNGIDVKSFFWGEGTKGTEQSGIMDVSIINGTNILEVKLCKHTYWIGVVSVDVEAYVEITFEGDIPQRSWWEVLQEWLVANWPLVAIATGLFIIGGVTYIYVARPKS